jgi:anaerobic magnesium-protoporphyrin IX monomethyl ester cyclase
MAKVLFINPVVREEDKPKHIPYGIALLASISINNGHLVQIYDANAWRRGFDILEQVCVADEWDVIAIGGLTTTYGFIRKACKIAKKVAPQAFLVAGGGFITSMPLEIMAWNPEIDLGVIGEAFVTFPEVLAKIDRKQFDFSETLGVCARNTAGKPYLTGVRPNIKDLDTLPYPAWDLFPLEIYFANSRLLFSEEAFTSKRRMDVNASLGCSLVCRYCWHLGTIGDMVVEENPQGEKDVRFSYGRNIRYHSARYIVDQVKTLHERYDVDFITFIDENLMTMDASSNRTWMFEVSRLWIEFGLQPTCRRDGVLHDERCVGVHWSGTSHATLARKDVLEAMFKAGCSSLVYGIESFDPGILKGLGKGTTVRHNKESLKTCLATGIKPIPNIIIGFPEETFQSVRNTVEALIELGIYAKPHFATPYPGSEWYYTYKESLIEQYSGDLEAFILDLGDASKITGVISHRFSAMQLLGLQQIVVTRDLRLLAQAEKHWADADSRINPVAVPKESFNFVRKKLQAPVAS